MTQQQEDPAVQGEAFGCLASGLDNPKNCTSPIRFKDLLRLSHLQRQYGLVGTYDALIATLHFDGGR